MKPGKVPEHQGRAAPNGAAPNVSSPLAASTPASTTDPANAPAAVRPDKNTVKMEGYLEKRGKMRVVGMWKRYWFVLEGRLLLYYKSQQEYTRLSPCRGSLNMGLASCVRPGASGAGPDQHVLEVVLRSHVVSLRAKDRTSQEQWLKALLDSMASSSSSSTTSPGKDNANGKGPLHFRYPSADNLNKAENPPGEKDLSSSCRKEKHRTLPNWTRTPSTEPQLVTVPEKLSTSTDTPEGAQEIEQGGLHIAPRKPNNGKVAKANLARQGSILPILGKKDKATPHSNSPRAIHPMIGQESSPFGNQRYSFHGFRKGEEIDATDSSAQQVASIKGNKDGKDFSSKPKAYKTFEKVLKKQLSFSSPSGDRDLLVRKDIHSPQILEEAFKTSNGSEEESSHCKLCNRIFNGGTENCLCKSTSTPLLEEEKENIILKPIQNNSSRKFHPDENQNQLFKDASFDSKMNTSAGRNRSDSETDLLVASGVDLSFGTPDGREFPKPIRCTSADELWSPPRKNMKAGYVKQMKFDHMCSDGHYSSASDIYHPTHTLESHLPETLGSDNGNLAKISLHQRLIHGNGEYIKYSEPEDCDKRDSTFNTTSDSQMQDLKIKPKIRLRKRKGSSNKDSYSLADNCENKKRAPVRNRLSFLTRVLSHVRRTKSEDIMDHPENEGVFSDDAFLSPHPDVRNKCSTPVARMLDDVKKMENAPDGPHLPVGTNFKLGPTNPVFGEAPEEPPPDYDSVGVEPVMNIAGCSESDVPPQLPPRRMKRPRSPWHDVPTNNSPVIDLDSDARQRLLSAAKYGRVIGTRTSHSMEFYDWSDYHASDHSQHHAYEVVSGDTSPAASNEHLAIYLSSESSDEEFHEDLVLQRNIKDREFLFGSQTQPNPFGNITNTSAMEPLTISTDILPTLDSFGRVGLSHVEAMKLNLLMQAQKTSTESVRRQKEEREKQESLKLLPKEETTRAKNVYEVSNDCLQLPPEEFADKEERRSTEVKDTPEKEMAEEQGCLTPVEKFRQSCGGSSENITALENDFKVEKAEVICISNEDLVQPPQLPTKKMRSVLDSIESEPPFRGSDELTDLLAQLAGMTTAPLLPVGTTCSLQMSSHNSNLEGEPMGSACNVPERKQSLSLEAVAKVYDSDPDYDVPRPHASLLHLLPQNRSFLNSGPDDDGIVVEATHFFSRPESPRHGAMEDQSWNGHMSPDSLDFPFLPRRSMNWDTYSSSSGKYQDRREPHKSRAKKDRSRRATLNGPIIQQPLESTSPSTTLIRRNSMEFPSVETEVTVQRGNKNLKERGMNEPKLVKILSPYEGAICEHGPSPFPSITQNYSHKLPENSNSLEDISEKSELNSDSVTLRPEGNMNVCRVSAKQDELDMDSLEASEFRKIEIPEIGAKALVSIKEEPDVLSDRSDGQQEGQSSGSASEGAVMSGGNSDSSATGNSTRNADTDMDMSSDDELGGSTDQNLNIAMVKIIEPDSLLPEPLMSENLDESVMEVKVDSESTKDTSLETDSLELKK